MKQDTKPLWRCSYFCLKVFVFIVASSCCRAVPYVVVAVGAPVHPRLSHNSTASSWVTVCIAINFGLKVCVCVYTSKRKVLYSETSKPVEFLSSFCVREVKPQSSSWWKTCTKILCQLMSQTTDCEQAECDLIPSFCLKFFQALKFKGCMLK